MLIARPVARFETVKCHFVVSQQYRAGSVPAGIHEKKRFWLQCRSDRTSIQNHSIRRADAMAGQAIARGKNRG
jgi:hypothetical protein